MQHGKKLGVRVLMEIQVMKCRKWRGKKSRSDVNGIGTIHPLLRCLLVLKNGSWLMEGSGK